MNSGQADHREVVEIAAAMRWSDDQRARFAQACSPTPVRFLDSHTPQEIVRELGEANVLVLGRNPFPALLEQDQLDWIHCNHAGIDGYAPPELLDGRFIITSASGRSAPALAEHALMFMLALNHRVPVSQRRQRRRVWDTSGLRAREALRGKTVLIIGAGHTGCEVARLCDAFGMTVRGYRRRSAPLPPHFASMASADDGDRLADLLADANFVVLAASLNTQSKHLLGKKELAALPRGAIVVNVGRGALLDQDALRHALTSGHLGGAGLDVTHPEPLPLRNRLWRCPNLMITPHVTPALPDRTERAMDMFIANLERFRVDAPLENQLRPEDAIAPDRHQPSPLERRVARLWRRIAR